MNTFFKCTKRKGAYFLSCAIAFSAFFMTGCASEQTALERQYQVYETNYHTQVSDYIPNFTSDLCVTEDVNYGTDQTDSQVAESAGVFNLDTKEVCYSQNIFEKLYPASTTKILTAYIIIRDCDLEDTVVVSSNAVDLDTDSSVCGVNAGDNITVRDLLYGLILPSGNDAALALAEYHSAGDVDAFAEEMNATALQLGATGSHFMNPHGLPDEEHYTTVYDMYLIFQAALTQEEFVEILSAKNYTAHFTDSHGNAVEKLWTSTNRYITGDTKAPDGFTVVGGKTGTTFEAGYCLVLYSLNENNEQIISIVFKADGRSNMYLLMNQILSGFAK